MCNRYIAYGRVQGVGFRYFVYELAIKLKFNGRVKNLSDGSVELIIDSNDQEKILEKIKEGNFFISVEKIIKIEKLEDSYSDFKIIY